MQASERGEILVVSVLLFCFTVSGCKILQSSTIMDKSGSGQPVSGVESSFGVLHLTVLALPPTGIPAIG
jgi:hypothetical protein